MNPPPLPNQSGNNANNADAASPAPGGLNPWRSGLAYIALACSTLGLAYSPVPFIGIIGVGLALVGFGLAGKVQTAIMRQPRPAGTSGENWLLDLAWVAIFILLVLGFAAAITVAGAVQAGSRGDNLGAGGTLPVILLLAFGVAIALAMLAGASRKAEPLQGIPLALYWMCHVTLPTLLARTLWEGSRLSN